MRQSPSSQAGRFSSAPLTPLPRSGFVQSAGTVRLRGAAPREERISVDAAAQRLGICVGSVHRLIRQGVLPAEQIMPSAPWQVPVAALATETVQIGVRDVIARRPKNFKALQDVSTLRLPGI